MTRASIAMVAMFTSACVARAGFGVGGTTGATIPIGPVAASPGGEEAAPPPPPATEAAAPVAAPAAAPMAGGNYAPGEDAHWFQADDYLVSDKKYEHQKMDTSVAKMTGAPADGTKGEAHFLYATGEDKWTAAFYKTRIATRADLRVGAIAFCYAPWYGGEAPKDKKSARNGGWRMAAITDNADLYKGRVTIGGESCTMGAVRVLAQ